MFKFLFILLSLFVFYLPISILAHSQTQIVEMTPNGFEPDTLTIDLNSSVIFVNKDSDSRWPASNVHPTHELYPEFDPKAPIEPGQSWAFKPEEAGQWKYHDHLKPHMRAVLTVVSEEVPVPPPPSGLAIIEKIKVSLTNLFNKIKETFSSQKNLKFNPPSVEVFTKLSPKEQEDSLKKFSKSESGDQAWQLTKASFKGQSGSSGNIHDLAHLSGKLIYESKGFDGIALCSSEFAFGCYHGFLDSAFSKNLDHLKEAETACLKLGTNQTISGPASSCIHGIGHGVASFHLVKDLKASLKSCRQLTLGKEYCFDGVFMEFVRSAPDKFFKADDPLYPCDELEKDFGVTYSFACGRNQPSLLMGRFKKGFAEVARVCVLAQSKPFREACVSALGFSLASTGNVSEILDGCQGLSQESYILECVKAAAGELVFQEAPNWDEKSKQICAASPKKSECMEYVDKLVADYKRLRKINFTPRQESEDLNAYIRDQLSRCYQANGRDGCYAQAAQALYDQLGFAKTLELLKTNEQFPEVYARCHEVTHYLSRFEYDKLKSVPAVYAQCDSTCHGGCYHGTLEAYLKDQQSSPNFSLSSSFAAVCASPADYQNPLEFNECLHGMGHAAMFVTDMELLESLKLCDTIPKLEYRERCYSGVFMENSSSSTSSDHLSKYLKPDDPFYPCNSLEEKYQPLCWQYQSSYFAIISGQDWQKVAQMCLEVPNIYQDRCFRAIGTNQVGFTSDLAKMKDDCQSMPTDHLKDVCVGGVISSLAYRFVGDAQKMINFCSLVNNDFKQTCFKQMGTAFLEWTNSKNQALANCQQIPDSQGISWCIMVL